jgi:N-acylneuraminate cytidylyltransferase/CMP-N,N'-diacetyllegionaminic acid synthase
MKSLNISKNSTIAIIGIRSGSKGLIDKNIKLLNGKPLIYWIVKTALNTPEINRVIVSTDSEKYAEIAKSCGAEVPFLRPAEISGDTSTDFEYVNHCLAYLKDVEKITPRVALRLMATVPFQKSQDLSKIIHNCLNNNVDSSVIVTEARQNPKKALKIIKTENGEKRLVSYITETGVDVTPTLRQDHDKAYFRANAIAFNPRVVSTTGTLTGNIVIPHIISNDEFIDIDSKADFEFAEFLMMKND